MEKHRQLTLTPRLQLLTDWIGRGAHVVDVGTDHGYLPAWLILNHRTPFVIASDLRKGPLCHAQETAKRFGLSEKINFRLCDGLSGISPGEVDTIIIAGMGGENIAAILSAAPWTKDGYHMMLLQPMSRAEELRVFLIKHGYQICREQLVRDRGVLYPVMYVLSGQMSLKIGQIYGGACLLYDPLENQYLIEQIIRLHLAVAGLNRSSLPDDQKKADRLRDVISALLAMREEWRHANCRTN